MATNGHSNPYENLVSELRSATRSIELSLGETTYMPKERTELLTAARALVSALESPDTPLWRVVFAPQAHAALLTAYEMRVFDAFGPEDKELSAYELSAITDVEELLIIRIMRALACLGIFDEVDESKWASNNISKKLANRTFGTFAMGLAVTVSSYMPSLPAYLSSIFWTNPSDHSHTLFNYALQTPMSMFEWLQTQPEKLAVFGATMAAANALKTTGVVATLSRLFPFETCNYVANSESKVLLVDVGGGKGDLIERFRRQRSDLVGRMIVQDLPKVIEGRQAIEGVELMVHDFFTPQPIKGAHTYFLRHIFHDWPDSASLAILRQIVAAMLPTSRIVIADMVLPDTGASLLGSLLDVGMMTVAGMERTERQWRKLLNTVGLQVMSIRHPSREENESASVIEAALAGSTEAYSPSSKE